MKMLLNIIKSRYLFSALLILLVFIQLVLVFGLISKYSIIVTILGYIFYIGVFIYIINKYENPEFKLPWIIILMLFNVMGAFVFLLLTSNDQNKKILTKFKKNKENINLYLKQDNTLEELKEENIDAYLQASYIKETTKLLCYKNTKVSYYKIGEDFHKELLKSLKDAEHFIFMEYFIIEEGKMWTPIYEILKKKAKSGIKVCITYDDFGCMTTLDDNYYKKLSKEGIACIPTNKFTPTFSKIHNNRDHRKITVIDGIVGFTGGINIADEYINEKVKYGHWKDTAIKLQGEAVKSLTALFLEIWNTQSKVRLNPEKFMNIKYEKNNSNAIIFPYGTGPEEFYEYCVGKNIYLNMINSSRKYIYITTPYLICDYEIINALCLCSKKGVDVRIIVPYIPDKKIILWMTQSNYEILIDSGVKIFEYTPGFIHAKQFICDDILATCGTINLDYRSLVHHFECGVWMYKCECINDMKNDFLETQKNSEEIKDGRNRLSSLKKMIVEIFKVFFPLF